MATQPEDKAREVIDRLLEKAGWNVCDLKDANIFAHHGVVIRNFPLKSGHGFADYLFYVAGKAAGIIEAKKAGSTLTGVEIQSDKYKNGLPDDLPAWHRPLPFSYQTTGIETRFTSDLDPDARSRNVFSFHRPETLAGWLAEPAEIDRAADAKPLYALPLRAKLKLLPPLVEEGLWPAQIRAIKNLERSLAENRPRALIQMATGSGKTFTAINFIYRLIKFAGAKRVLFLVDRGNLADQTLKEFQQYISPYNNYKFHEEYIIQRLTTNTLDTTARVCICTIQRLYSMLKGKDLPLEDEEESVAGLERLIQQPELIEYNPLIPIESFDFIIADECHRSIYNLWAQVLEYFDAFLIGLTATPNKQTFGFFNQNLVMEYPHEQAVADGVNVNYDVYRIRTSITEAGSMVEAGYYVQKQDRDTRERRWEQLSDDFEYDPNELDRNVVAPGQIRTIIRSFRDKLKTEIFPGREWLPKTLIFAKDDNHAENIVEIVREEFGQGNDFAQKITYRTTGARPQDLIKAFRTSPMPRIAVTVDMIATGTDIKPVEIVFFMRAVKSRTFFEQMKGRGVRIINPDDLKSVTPDAVVKDRFVIIDAVGVCEQDKTDSRPMERVPSVPFEKLLQAIGLGSTNEDMITSLAGRLARMEHRLKKEDEKMIRQASGGFTLKELSLRLLDAVDSDRHIEHARLTQGFPSGSHKMPDETAITAAAQKLTLEALKPFSNPGLRQLLQEIKEKNEIVIDQVSPDTLIFAGFSQDRAKGVIESFEKFIEEHHDEITALQILYSKSYKARLKLTEVEELADKLVEGITSLKVYQTKPKDWEKRIPEELWQAYQKLYETRVRRHAGIKYILTDLISLVRFAIHQENELVPFPEKVNANFNAWLAQQENSGKKFTDEQRRWLEMIKNHIAANLSIEADDFDYAPFVQEGGIGKVHQVFGDGLKGILEEMNEVLAA